MNENHVYVIGENFWGELGLDHKENVKELTRLNTLECITHIDCSSGNIIFTIADGNYLISGKNEFGQCNFNVDKDYIFVPSPVYFIGNNIKIMKVGTNVYANSIFWITDKNTVYGNICSGYPMIKKYPPSLIDCLNDVMDVKSTDIYSIALCKPLHVKISKLIISDWVRNTNYKQCINIVLPTDIIQIISLYCIHFGHVYWSKKDTKIWSKIDLFDDENIVSIECGGQCCMALGNNGTVWCAYKTPYEWIEYETKQPDFKIIPYFVNHKIKIINIKVGRYHNLAIDSYGNAFSWGNNGLGQCGDDTTNNIKVPKLIVSLFQHKVIDIKCGTYHSYVYANDSHYLFGGNIYNECSITRGTIFFNL
eukprot:54073_1